MKIPRFLIAAPSSGSGKTVIACGLMRALKNSGKRVVSAKCGPDYIDPMFHRTVLKMDAMNLDLFFYEKETMQKQFAKHCKGADVAVMEGVMGFYDGMGIDTEFGSSYDVARSLDAPVILVIPCKGSSLSVVAQIKGFLEFRKDNNIQGLILNRVSKMLYPRMKAMVEEQLKKEGHEIKVIGYVPENPILSLESRHLGLVTPQEIGDLEAKLDQISELISETVDLSSLLRLADGAKEFPDIDEIGNDKKNGSNLDKVRIAVARDEAFCFYYKENLELLEQSGCELVYFSPLREDKLPDNVQGLLLGGGYPEIYAKELSDNSPMMASIRNAIEHHLPCHAECGGFLYLHESMKDAEGVPHKMVGIIEGECYPEGRLVRFGYVNLNAKKDGAFLKKGETIKGHEFHYWNSSNNGEDVLAVKPDGKRTWECIHSRGNLFAGFAHLAYASNEEFVKRFVMLAKQYEKKEG